MADLNPPLIEDHACRPLRIPQERFSAVLNCAIRKSNLNSEFWLLTPEFFKIKNIDIATTMEVLDIKREVETLSQRLGKTQDYL